MSTSRKKRPSEKPPTEQVPLADDATQAAVNARKAWVSAYNSVVDASELSNVLLISLTFSVDPEYYSDDGSDRKLRFDAEVDTPHFDSESGSATGLFHWFLEAKKGEEVQLSVKSSWYILYTGLKDQNEDAIRAFVERIGRLATYPYFRTLVSQITWASGTNLPIMPVLREGHTGATRVSQQRLNTAADTESG
jgi:hypothetical protein